MARDIELKRWDRHNFVKGASYTSKLKTTGRIILRMGKESAVVGAGKQIEIPEKVMRYEVIAAYGPATVTIT